MSELFTAEQGNQIRKRIDIVRKNCKSNGLIDYPKERKILMDAGETLLNLSINENQNLANLLSVLQTNNSLIGIVIQKLKSEYATVKSLIHKIIEEQGI